MKFFLLLALLMALVISINTTSIRPEHQQEHNPHSDEFKKALYDQQQYFDDQFKKPLYDHHHPQVPDIKKPILYDHHHPQVPDIKKPILYDQNRDPFFLGRRGSRFPYYYYPRYQFTCTMYPKMCNAPWSPGPDCCKKNGCVDLSSDRYNCGKCGIKCKYSEICCGGKCVNPWFSKDHCGGCNNSCNKDGFCAYGMCNYS